MAYPTDTPLDADSAVVAFHNKMLAKGNSFYGIAVQPPKGKDADVKGHLESVLTQFGYVPNLVHFKGYIVFEGEFSPKAIEAVRQYLTAIEAQTPSIPIIRRGDYFQMSAYKWLDDIVQRPKFNGYQR